MPDRRQQLADRLAALHERIAAAASNAQRDPDEIGLVVVTKTHPASDVRLLHELGVRDFGENRVQEAAAKAAEVADLPDVCWHQIGQVQTNKANQVGRWADVVHSVDRSRLVTALSRGAQNAGRELTCLIQVSLDGDTGRGGAPTDRVLGLAEEVAAAEGVLLGGVMAVAPLGVDPRPAFDILAAVAARVREVSPGAATVSAGMSADLEAAISAGATLLRVGTAILGSRPPLQ